MTPPQDIYGLAQAIAQIVQQQGQQDFPSYNSPEDRRTATLCGLTVYIRSGMVMAIKARDMVIEIDHDQAQGLKPANDHSVISLNDHKKYRFSQGNAADLQRWYSRLIRMQTVFCQPPLPSDETIGTA